MKNKLTLIMILTIAVFLTGCTDATRAKIGGYGDEHLIEMYSGGEKVREWTASGKVLSEKSSDGYYFNDKLTGRLVEVSGDIVITKL
jgi:hypothetical protein